MSPVKRRDMLRIQPSLDPSQPTQHEKRYQALLRVWGRGFLCVWNGMGTGLPISPVYSQQKNLESMSSAGYRHMPFSPWLGGGGSLPSLPLRWSEDCRHQCQGDARAVGVPGGALQWRGHQGRDLNLQV